MGGREANGEIPGEEGELACVGGDVTRDGNDESDDEEGEFDRYEPQSPATPASSSRCPTSPTTPASSRSSTLSDCYPKRSVFPSTTYIAKSMGDPTTTSMQLQTLFTPTTTAGSPIAQTSTQKPKPSISDLPLELLQQIFKYALDENWMYDYLEEDGNSVTWHTGSDGRGIVIADEHGAHFRVMRVEIQLSQDLWKLGNSFKKCIHITGQQWFNPFFPSYILEGEGGYNYINISFSGFTVPPEYFRQTNTLYDAPLFDEPEGSNYHDGLPPRRRILLHSTTYIRLKLNNRSNVAIDKVLENIDFPLYGALTIITTVNSESRFYVSERYYKGLRLPMTGGILYADDGSLGSGELEDGISLGFEINSWLRDWGHEVGARIGDMSRWFCMVPDGYELHVKLPIVDGMKKKWEVPRVGWLDKIAQIFSSHPEPNIWDEWDNTRCDQGRLGEHQFEFARLEGFSDEAQQLEFSLIDVNDEGVASHRGYTWRDEMLVMLHPLKRNIFPSLRQSGSCDFDNVRVKGYDVSGQAMVKQEGFGSALFDTQGQDSSNQYHPTPHLPTHPLGTSLDSHLRDSLSRLTRGNGDPHHPGPRHAASFSDLRKIRETQSQTNSRRGSQHFNDFSLSRSDSPRLNCVPSTPTIRKRASMHTLSTSSASTPPPGSSGRLSRKSSLLGLGTDKKGAKDGEEKEGFRPLSPQPPALTAVILHDATYKHKFSRPKTSKAELATIVERPERITAAIMGVCAAQTRLGGHKLSIHKTRRLGSLQDPEVMLVHASGGDKGKWLSELTQLCNSVGGRHRKGECEVPSGKGWNSGDLYLGPSSKEALEGCVGAVYEAVDRVFTGAGGAGVTRRAFVAIRPPGHHCAETTPSGFCWLNNVHVGIAHAARVHGLTHAVILDIDLHHGDGSSKLQPPSPVPKVAYFSLHDIDSFPCEAGDPEKIRDASVDLDAHGQMIVNIHLKKYHTLAEFWEIYETVYSRLLSRAKEWLVREMDTWREGGREIKAAVFISTGFDASEHEMSGMQRHKVHVPTGFYARFTRESVALAEDEGTGCNGRVVSVLEGGYSNRAIMSGVLAHLVGLSYETPARAMFRHHQAHRGISEEYLYEDGVIGNGEYGMGPHGGTPGDFLGGEGEGFAVDYYDPQWWDIEHLVELENKTAKRPKKVTPGAPVNYLSATAASKAKVEAKVLIKQAARVGNGPPPPPVIIDWATATVDLSKSLILQEDQDEQPPSPTLSVASTTRGASKRHSVAGHGDEGLTKMVLRERKAKPTAVEECAASRAGGDRRRKSVAGVVTSPAVPATTTAPNTRSGRVPPMQRIPSRGPSPAPGHGPPPVGGRRVVSMGMPPLPQRTSSARKDGVRNLRGDARINKSASTTPSPPPSVSVPPPPAPGRGLRRVNSTSNIQTFSGPTTRGAARASGKSGAAKKGASPPPQSLSQGQDSEGDSIEDALVKGMRKIRITYKAGEEAQKQQQQQKQQQSQSRPSSGSSGDKDARVRELERLAEEKQREIEQLKKEAKERAVAHKVEKKGVEKRPPSPATALAATGANVSAVRMAAMKLEASGGPGKVEKLQTQVGDCEAGKGGSSPGTPTSRSPLGQSPFAASTPPQAKSTTTAKQPLAGKGGKQLPKPISTTGTTNGSKPSSPPTQNAKLSPTTNGGGVKMTTTVPSPTAATSTAMGPPPPPQIITIPPTRPTSSWDHDLTAAGANEQGIGMLGVAHGYEYDAGEEDHAQNDVNAQGNESGGEGASEMSPPPPYSTAVRADQGPGQQGQQQGVQGQVRQAAGGFGFNVMKPLTVGLGGGGQGQ
ncbi:histone deacetylase domain-containing protein [Tirmania nivea]|nr:histone deacetylase domain-containing protein [Tirmania nivea]